MGGGSTGGPIGEPVGGWGRTDPQRTSPCIPSPNTMPLSEAFLLDIDHKPTLTHLGSDISLQNHQL